MADQVQDLCLYQSESAALDLEIFDEDGELLDLTGKRVYLVVWNASGTLFTKDSDVGPAEALIDPDQVANTGQATVFVLPADVATAGLYSYNVWLDDGSDQDLVVPPSRFHVLASRRV